jgi:hypothetical protein
MPTARKKPTASAKKKAVTRMQELTDNLEDEYTLELVVIVPGYGKKRQQEQHASNVKRQLEVSLHSKIEVYRVVEGSIMDKAQKFPRLEKVKSTDRKGVVGWEAPPET